MFLVGSAVSFISAGLTVSVTGTWTDPCAGSATTEAATLMETPAGIEAVWNATL